MRGFITSPKRFIAGVLTAAAIMAGGGVPGAAAGGQAPITGLWVTPLEIDFGPVGLGAASAQAVVTLTNYSTAVLDNFVGGGVTSPFSSAQDCAGGVAPGGTCRYYFNFSPTAEGEFTTESYSGTSLGNITIKLHGTGVGAKMVYDGHSLDMGSVLTGVKASQQVVTLRNVGLAQLSDFAGGGLSPPFSVSQDCGGVIPPGGQCHYYFDFLPDAVGSFTAISDTSTGGGPVTIAVKGSGRSPIFALGQRVSPLSLDFGPVGVGTTSPALQAQVQNQSFLSAISGFAGGGVSPPFSGYQNCAAGVAAGGNCSFSYTFAPAAPGEFTTSSTVTDSAGSFSVQLHGTGVPPAASASPLWLDLGPVSLNSTSPVQTVTITNTGLSPITGWAGGGAAPPFNAIQECDIPGGLLPGNSCNFTYTFTPEASGFFTTQTRIYTNAGFFQLVLQGGPHPTEYLLGLTFPGTGAGTVSVTPVGITCSNDCSRLLPAGSTAALNAVAAEYSTFSGWSGNCSGEGYCTYIADADKGIGAIFAPDTLHKARIGGGSGYFPTLTQAYGGASSSGTVTIEAWGTLFKENLSCNEGKRVIIKGGYRGDYSSNSAGVTTLQGTLSVTKGTLIVEKVIIR